MLNKTVLSAAVMLFAANVLSAAPFEQVNKGYNRISSRVMIRKIATPTLANLDYAAYTANPVRFDPQPMAPKKPAKKVGIAECTFGGALSSPCASIKNTPLTEAEREMPVAWDPLQNKLWDVTKTDQFAKVGAKINGWKWADSSMYIPYQEVVAAYLHGQGEAAEVWVKIEFKPWVRFLDATVTDEDKDGFKELYGRLNIEAVDKTVRQKAFDRIRGDYCKALLTKEQVVDWANALASYWYPKLNTDVVDMTGQTKWPTAETEKDIVRELKGLVVDNPLVVIRGTPYGKKLFNIYLVDFPEEKKPAQAQEPAAQVAAGPVALDSSVSKNFRGNNARFETEIKTFGEYPVWAKKYEPFRQAAASFVKTLPPAQMGFKGRDDWLFFRGEISYMNGGDLLNQAPDKNPLPHLAEFNKLLKSKNISLLVVAVPNKSDVYFEKLPVNEAPAMYDIVNPYARKILKDLQNAGVEVVDLLPAFLAAKKEDPRSAEALYQRQDTHWSGRGLDIAASLIADRIKEYSWYGQTPKIKYTVADTVISRQGDLVDKLAEADKTAYKPASLRVQQVHLPDGSLLKAKNPEAPVALIGDSFTGIFELIDPKAAGVGAHIAAQTGLPVEIFTSWGGGPLVRETFYRARKDKLDKKCLVIYLMVSRDLYNYGQLWQPLEIK
jgi:hypothetical protein